MKTGSKFKSIGCIFLALVVLFTFTPSVYADQTYLYVLESSYKTLNLYNNGTAKINLYKTVDGARCYFEVNRISGAKPFIVTLVTPSNESRIYEVTQSRCAVYFKSTDVKGNYKLYVRNRDTDPSKNIYTQLNHTFIASTTGGIG